MRSLAAAASRPPRAHQRNVKMQRVVDAAGEEPLQAVFLAARTHGTRPCVVDGVAVRIALDDRDALPFQVSQRRRGHVSAAPPDEDEPVLEIRLRT